MNTALKIIIGILVILAVAWGWMYFSGTSPMNGNTQDNGEATTPPPATGSLDDIQAAVDADVSGDTTLTQGDDSAAAALVGASSVTNASGAASGSY